MTSCKSRVKTGPISGFIYPLMKESAWRQSTPRPIFYSLISTFTARLSTV